jgi:RNA polymerase sigma factor (sigma-70 family)
MPDVSDMVLLRDYARHGSEEAFAELVRRHVNLVYSAALRQVGIAAHAEEIAQAVFIILAQKAARLRPDTILEGWFFQTTRLASLSFLRGERRRHWREQEAFMQSNLQESGEPPIWNQLAPLLDEALARLGKTDREAVVLRYFKGKSLNEVATALKTTEAAAQSRVHRAVGKLQKYFLQRGIDSTTAAIAGTISANSVCVAPVTLAKTISAVAVTKGTAASTSTLTLIKGALKIMAWTKAKTAFVVGAGLLLAAGPTTVTVKEIRQHHHYSWQVGNPSPKLVDSVPPQVKIVPTIFSPPVHTLNMNNGTIVGIQQTLNSLLGAGSISLPPIWRVGSKNISRCR